MDAAPLHSGYVIKKPMRKTYGPLGTSKTRYMVLQVNGMLSYYESEAVYKTAPSNKKGQLLITPKTRIEVTTETSFQIIIDAIDTLFLQCETHLEAVTWIRQINYILDLHKTNQILPPPIPPTKTQNNRATRFLSFGKKFQLTPSNPKVTKRIVHNFDKIERTDEALLDPKHPMNVFCTQIWNGDMEEVINTLQLHPHYISEMGCVYTIINEDTSNNNGNNNISNSIDSVSVDMLRPSLSQQTQRITLSSPSGNGNTNNGGTSHTGNNKSNLQLIRRGYPIALAAEQGHTGILNVLMNYAGAKEQIRVSRMSLVNNNWIVTPQRSESFGFHPVKVDETLRETFSKMKLDSLFQSTGVTTVSPLVEKYLNIMVDRRGNMPNAYMTTVTIINEISIHDECYVTMDTTQHEPKLVIKSTLNNNNNDSNSNNTSSNNSSNISNNHGNNITGLRSKSNTMDQIKEDEEDEEDNDNKVTDEIIISGKTVNEAYNSGQNNNNINDNNSNINSSSSSNNIGNSNNRNQLHTVNENNDNNDDLLWDRKSEYIERESMSYLMRDSLMRHSLNQMNNSSGNNSDNSSRVTARKTRVISIDATTTAAMMRSSFDSNQLQPINITGNYTSVTLNKLPSSSTSSGKGNNENSTNIIRNNASIDDTDCLDTGRTLSNDSNNSLNNNNSNTGNIDNDKNINTIAQGDCNNNDDTSTVHYLEFKYTWNIEQISDAENINIFGENSYLQCDYDELKVPINECSVENLLYFNCLLLDTNESQSFQFEIPSDIDFVPLTEMSVGEDYVEGFIMQDSTSNGGMGGAYLEWHDVPHFHMPLNNHTKGYLVVGRMNPVNETIQLGAFTIPYGKAVYMKPFTLHNDCFLIGKYHVMYASTDNFATGTVVNRNNQCSKFSFFNPNNLNDATVVRYGR